MKKKKIFVLDTNVILHDHRSIYSFEDNDIVIPIIVLEELDKFKRGTESRNFQAREFVRIIDTLIEEDILEAGVSLGEGYGLLTVEVAVKIPDRFTAAIDKKVKDNQILAIADKVAEANVGRDTILVTKDINLRLKAKSLQIKAQDYKKGKVDSISIIDECNQVLYLDSGSPIDKIYKSGFEKWSIVKDTLSPIKGQEDLPVPSSNSYYVLKSGGSSVITRFNSISGNLEKVKKVGAYGIKPRNVEQGILFDALLNKDIPLISITGKAGTGKTLLALAAALEQSKEYSQIMLARPIIALSNRDLGFLPGDAEQKISPYMAPLFDNLSVIKQSFNSKSVEVQRIEEMQKSGDLIISPLAFIRGRSLSNTFFIIDEAQNLTPHEVKTIVTRAGEGTKVVFTGDINQIDSPYLDQLSNGLTFLTHKMKDQVIFAHVNLVKGERSALAELASRVL